jgi:hypothetical protein
MIQVMVVTLRFRKWIMFFKNFFGNLKIGKKKYSKNKMDLTEPYLQWPVGKHGKLSHWHERHERPEGPEKPESEPDYLWNPLTSLKFPSGLGANLDAIFNFTLSDGGILAPQTLGNFAAINGLGDKGITEYILWRRPESVIYHYIPVYAKDIYALADVQELQKKYEEQIQFGTDPTTWIQSIIEIDVIFCTPEQSLRWYEISPKFIVVDSPLLTEAFEISKRFEDIYIIRPVTLPWYEKRFFLIGVSRKDVENNRSQKEFEEWYRESTKIRKRDPGLWEFLCPILWNIG